MHAFQDVYTHGAITPIKHAILGHTPDKIYVNPALAGRMAQASFDVLKGGNNVMAQRGYFGGQYKPIDWKKLEPFVQRFNEARTMAQKQKIAGEARAMIEANHRRQDEEMRKRQEPLMRLGVRLP